jgi:hypothetical protein
LALIGPSTAAKFGGREESAGLSNYKPVVLVDLFGAGDRYRHAPVELTEKVRASIKREKLVCLIPRSLGPTRCAAVLVCAMGLSALATGHVMRSSQEKAFLKCEILTARVRSLVQDRPVQIA